MKLIIGLGNPGLKYKKTRHNLGFRILNELQKENDFPKFKFAKRFKADISEGILNGERTILAKPQTFMNSSGQAVKALVGFYKLDLKDLIVVHDDLDLPVGEFKISENSSSAGHNGVKSIIQELGTQDFARVRLGIKSQTPQVMETKDFVLAKFTKEEKVILDSTIKKAVIASAVTAVGGDY